MSPSPRDHLQMRILAMHTQGNKCPLNSQSARPSGEALDWVAMALEHQADSVTIVEDDEEEEREGKGEEKIERQKQTKSCWCQRL